MNKLLTTFILTIYSLAMYGQDKITNELKNLSDNNQYDEIIKKHSAKSKDYSAKSLYYIGLAYYMKEDDNNCIKFMDLSINKDRNDPGPHYIKASTLNYMGKHNEAVQCFQTAINLKSDDSEFYNGIGLSYYELKNYELALENYKKATQQNRCPDSVYNMIGQIYTNLKQNDKALEAYYIAKSKIVKTSSSYSNTLFNIGLLEILNGNYEKAESAFGDVLKLDPTDYHCYAKLIQIYYHKKEYEKAKPFKDKLYEAYQKGLLKDHLKDMFCFDQFKWNGYSVKVFERYQNESKGDIYNKHIFYVTDNFDKLVLRVQTEFSPVSVELGGPKYLLCANKGATHYNPLIGFNDNFEYDNLKNQAIKLFETYIK